MTRSASSTTTLAPRRANASAAESPVNPPPMTATSAVSRHRPGLGAGEGRRRVVPVGDLFHSLQADQRRQAAEIRHLMIAIPRG